LTRILSQLVTSYKVSRKPLTNRATNAGTAIGFTFVGLSLLLPDELEAAQLSLGSVQE